MARDLYDEAQLLMEEEKPKIPQSVSNRLLMATIINVKNDLKREINGNVDRLDKHEERINGLIKSDRRWGAVSMIIAAAGSVIASLIGLEN